MPRNFRVAAFLFALMAVTAVGRAATVTVQIRNFYFTPTNITINVGDTVTWVNAVATPHDSTQPDGAWASGPLGQDESFSHTFTSPGSFNYFCAIHFALRREQTGTVTVVQANLPPAVNITGPSPGTVFSAPASFTVTAAASDSDGAVTSVEFFVNGVSVGASSGPVFSVPVSGLAVGTHTLTARATDNSGAQTTSDPVSVIVEEMTPANSYALTVSVNPPEGGTVQISPPPNAPDGKYFEGTVVTLTAAAGADRTFAGWSGSVSGMENPLTLTIAADTSVTANFNTTTVPGFALTLITNPPAGGSIAADPAPNGPNGTYLEGTTITLTATPAPGFRFDAWSNAVSGSANSVQLVMDAEKTVAANFVPVLAEQFTLTITVAPANAGEVSVTPPPGTNGTYAAGSTVALAAQPAAGFQFRRWTGDVISSNNPLLLVMTADRSVVAEFEPLPSLDFARVAGKYAGLLFDESEINFATSGFLNLRVARNGAYRGTGIIGGKRQTVRGQFDRFGYAPLVLRRGTVSGSLLLDKATGRITGVLTDGASSPTLLLSRMIEATNTTVFTGDYDLRLGTNEVIALEGTARASIISSGAVRIRGALGDGTRFAQRTFLTPEGRVPVFVLRYQRRGAILGWLDFPGDSTSSGTLRWLRPADSRQPEFPEGFAVEMLVSGGRAE